MSPDEFRQRFADALADEPLGPPAESDIAVAQGRHRLRRDRLVVGTGACLAVATVLVASALVLGLDDDRDKDSAPAVSPEPSLSRPRPVADKELLEQCRNGEFVAPHAADLLFQSGTPVIKGADFNSFDGSAALESADGRYWAQCFIAPGDPRSTGMMVLTSSGTRDGTSTNIFVVTGAGCGPSKGDRGVPGCSKFNVQWTERLPAEVASVEFVMTNGETVSVVGNDGYFVLEYVGELPSNKKPRLDELQDPFLEGYRSITYLDAEGTPIAQERNGPPVDELPGLGAYPGIGSFDLRERQS